MSDQGTHARAATIEAALKAVDDCRERLMTYYGLSREQANLAIWRFLTRESDRIARQRRSRFRVIQQASGSRLKK
jgi:hypothetical protein